MLSSCRIPVIKHNTDLIYRATELTVHFQTSLNEL